MDQRANSPPAAKRSGFFVSRARRALLGAVGAYSGFLAILMWAENGMLYPAPRTAVGPWNQLEAWRGEDVHFAAADGTKLHGWYFAHKYPKRVMLLAHGNGENVAMAAQEAVWLHDTFDASVFVFDYRGYGKSEGEPSEQGLYQDGEAAAQWLAKKAGVQVSELYLVGRSLGTGVMVDVGVKHQSKALILLSPYAEMPDPAANRFWFAPVRLLMRNRYPSVKKIPQFKGGTFIAHGDLDNLVPQWSGKKLFDAAPEPKQWLPLADTGHNNINLTQCEKQLKAFLAKLEAK